MRQVLMAFILAAATVALAQTPASSNQDSHDATSASQAAKQPEKATAQQPMLSGGELQKIVAHEFGPGFSVLPGFPVLEADLDGDGRQDLVIIGTADDPMLNQAQFHYKIADPYDTFFGFGDPRVTSKFEVDSGQRRMLLVIHNWQAPKEKFVLINVPFQKLQIGRALVKKKVVTAIKAEETEGQSFIYWAGKKYKWNPGNN